MNKKIVCAVVFLGLFCLLSFVLADGSSAKIVNPLCPSGGSTNGPGCTVDFVGLLGKIATGAGLVVGALGTVMLIVAGILYLTSAGSPERAGQAKKALIYAIAGIAIGIAASTLSSIVVGILSGKT